MGYVLKSFAASGSGPTCRGGVSPGLWLESPSSELVRQPALSIFGLGDRLNRLELVKEALNRLGRVFLEQSTPGQSPNENSGAVKIIEPGACANTLICGNYILGKHSCSVECFQGVDIAAKTEGSPLI